jgi:hypothetical protein
VLQTGSNDTGETGYLIKYKCGKIHAYLICNGQQKIKYSKGQAIYCRKQLIDEQEN